MIEQTFVCGWKILKLNMGLLSLEWLRVFMPFDLIEIIERANQRYITTQANQFRFKIYASFFVFGQRWLG